jgi:hypothetical protein
MVKSGPGRANSKLEVNLVGTGKFLEPAGIAIPTRTLVNLLPSASLTCVINGIDYITTKNFVSWEFEWQNNIRKESNLFPGSGFQTTGTPASGAVAGRMEFGDRKVMSKLVARFDANSTEYDLLTAQTAGTLAIGLSGTNSTSASLAMPQIRFKTTELGNVDGIVTVEVEHSAQVPAGQTVANLLTWTVNHSLGSLGRS